MIQTDDFFCVNVADMRFEFLARECYFSDTSFRGFAVRSGMSGWTPPHGDTISVKTQMVQEIATPSRSLSFIFGETDNSVAQTCSCKWYVHQLESGVEQITVFFHNHESLRAAQISFDSTKAALSVEKIVKEERTVDPCIFPLFNIFLSRLLLRRGGFLIHASAVCLGSRLGMLFTAPSGTGKSTIARLLQTWGALIINDDMLALRSSTNNSGRTSAFAVPMAAYSQQPMSATIKGLFVISQSPVNTVQREYGAKAVALVMSNVVQQPLNAQSVSMLTKSVASLVNTLPVFSLGFCPDAEIVPFLKKVLRDNPI